MYSDKSLEPVEIVDENQSLEPVEIVDEDQPKVMKKPSKIDDILHEKTYGSLSEVVEELRESLMDTQLRRNNILEDTFHCMESTEYSPVKEITVTISLL